MQLLQAFSSSRCLKGVTFLVVPLVPRNLRTAIPAVVAGYRGEGCNIQVQTSPHID